MKRLYDFFLFRYLHRDYIELSQARLTLNFCLITSIFSLLYVAIARLINFQASVLIMSLLSLLFLGLAFLIRRGVHLQIVSFIYLVLSFTSAIVLVYHSGMIYSSILPWLSFIPLVAILLQNRIAAFVWLGICFITVFAFAFLQENYSNTPVQYDKQYEVWFFAGVYNGLTGIILVLSMIFQKAKDNVLKGLEEKNQYISSINTELKSKNEEIVAQNEELLQQKEQITAQREFIEIKNRELLLVQDELNTLVDKLTATQDALASREAEYRSILDSLYDSQLLVGEIDLEGTVVRISSEATKFFKAEQKEILGKSIKQIGNNMEVHLENSIDYDDMLKNVINGKNSSHETMLVINENEYWLKENYFTILDNQSKPLKIMIISQDISQIKHQQKEIEELNKNLKLKLSEIKKQNNQLAKQQKEIEKINSELKRSNSEIVNINQNLEKRVNERTKNLELQNKQLTEYAYINAHLLRGPLCSILGLVQLMENGNTKDSASIVMHMKKSSEEMHKIVNKISSALEKGAHFDRKELHKS